MFKVTKNPYSFKYLITGISGPGLKCVYLPEVPAKKDIIDLGGKVWVRPTPPSDLQKWVKEETLRLKTDPEYVHPELNAYIAREFERREKGLWFWNGSVPTYITGFYYYYLTHYQLDFGFPEYREPDKEVTYFIKYCEEDPQSYGLLYNTLRRAGKSSLMGGWLTERITRTKNANGGIQGEKTEKAGSFFNKCILYPFRKLPSFFRPEYDKNSQNKTDLLFYQTVKRGRKVDDDFDFENQLESKIDYRNAGELAYDGEKLYAYVGEEVGKTKEANVYERWLVVKFALEQNGKIWGCSFSATTTEEMDGEGSAGDNYWRLFEDSDIDVKVNGKTKSGLYACFLPADCGPCGNPPIPGGDPYDKHGHPYREINRIAILEDRKALEGQPRLLAGLIRKKPLTIGEAFYSDSDKCVFNAMVLQERKAELLANPRTTTKGNFAWVNGKRDSEVTWIRDDVNGKFEIYQIIDEESERNKITSIGVDENGVTQWRPLNNHAFRIGSDPIDHGGGVGSSAAAHVFRMYNPSVDGVLSETILEERRLNKYKYKTGIPIVQYLYRPDEPTVFYEHMIMLCRYFGCQIHVESNRAGLINHFRTRGYREFLMGRPDITMNESLASKEQLTPGTPGSKFNTNIWVDLTATHIQYFGHCTPFIKLVEQWLKLTPEKTTKFDLAVSMGFTLEAAEHRVAAPRKPINLSNYFTQYDNSGAQSKVLE